MSSRQNPFYWSFGIGTWFGTRVRVSVFFPVLIFLFWWNLPTWQMVVAVSAILFISILLHEIGHVYAARKTGGFADEILIWPLGGLAFVDTVKSFRAQFLTALAGPLVNLSLCALAFPLVLSTEHAVTVWNPLFIPVVPLDGGNLLHDLAVITFSLNWFCLLFNLLPIFPLDGSRMLQAWLNIHFGSAASAEISLRVGIVAAILVGLVAFLCNSIWLLALSFLIVLIAQQETQRVQSGDPYDDSFMGIYDFSQGYTSLEQSQVARPEPRPSLFQRWKEKRRVEKQKRQELLQQQAEDRLDSILAKIKEKGLEALSDAERRHLNQASARCRDKFKPHE